MRSCVRRTSAPRTRARARQALGSRGILEAPDRTRLPLEGDALLKAFNEFKKLADRKKSVHDADLIALASDERAPVPELWALDTLQVVCGSTGLPTATVRLRDPDGKLHIKAMVGTGPVDAAYKAIDSIVKDAGEAARVWHQRRDRRHRRARGSQRARAPRGPAFEPWSRRPTPTSSSPVPRPTSPPSITCFRATVRPGRSTRKKPPKGPRSTSEPCPTPNPDSSRIFDTTLRDGGQTEGISYSVDDKLRIARKLDELGVAFIEGGWPGSNPKDALFFEQARIETWTNAKIVAFGALPPRQVETRGRPERARPRRSRHRGVRDLRQDLRVAGRGGSPHDVG
ncbi:MAG: alpha-isopropylmalate synthase regulatory domain-containing protein [Lacunisphaera sp.]